MAQGGKGTGKGKVITPDDFEGTLANYYMILALKLKSCSMGSWYPRSMETRIQRKEGHRIS